MSIASQSVARPRHNLRLRGFAAAALALIVLPVVTACASAGRTAVPSTPPAAASPAPGVQAPRTVAVLPLAGGTGVEGLGFAIAEILSRDLALVPRLRVVERARLDAILRELGLGTTGRVAPQSVPRAGQLAGAERLVSGTVTRTPNGASIDLSVLNVASGLNNPVASERIALNELIDAQERLAVQLFARLGVTLTPAERERLAKRPTRRVDALIAFGNGRRAEALNNMALARQYYAQASRLDPAFVDASGAMRPDLTASVLADGPAAAPERPIASGRFANRPSARRAFDSMLDELMLSVTDRVVRPAALPAVCPPICPALAASSGGIVVRITP